MNRVYTLLICMILGSILNLDARERLSLGGEWMFRQANTEEWMPASVPGCVHTDLIASGAIPDPYYSDNEKHLQWIGEKDWEYVKEFEITEQLLEEEHVELQMNGIDTYADIYVNGKLLMRCSNMFRTWKADIKPFLRAGTNTIRIYFHSVFRVDIPKYLDAPFKRMAWPNNDQSDIWLSLYARKAGFHYGWDWGPRLITAGIWRDIFIRAWSGIELDNVFIRTLSIPDSQNAAAEMEAICKVRSDISGKRKMTVTVEGEKYESIVSLRKGDNTVSMRFSMDSPELWWCNGAGKQRLYDFDIEISGDDCSPVRMTVTTGVRTVDVVREDDEYGKSMYIVLNGRPIFMKGANYIPSDNFQNRVSATEYEHTIRTAAESNMNMLRIWGGGIYEDDAFYNLCDKYGILIWQDMMFACGMFPADEEYLENVANEVRDNVIRLRNHPSIALWNGNNENEISYFGWGWRNRLSPEDDKIYQADLKKLFYDVIPGVLDETDGTRYYHPTSPVTGYNGIDANYGDVHFWSVWKGGWIEEYEKPENIGRFMSEYGFQSYPELPTIRKVIPENQQYVGSNALLSHQRARNDETKDPNFGDNMMKMYMTKYFWVPENFDHFIYMSQLMQAEAVKKAIEAHRRAKPYCMGSLYWQINDCWPVASWSSMDYYGNWKPLQYYAKRLFCEILPSAYEDSDNNVVFKVISDRNAAFNGELSIKVMTLGGESVNSLTIPVGLKPDGCETVLTIAKEKLFGGAGANEVFVSMKISENGKMLSENIYYPEYPNRYDYSEGRPEIRCRKSALGITMYLESSALIRDLWFSVDHGKAAFRDNAVTLIPGEEKRIEVETEMSVDEFKSALKWVSINTVQNAE